MRIISATELSDAYYHDEVLDDIPIVNEIVDAVRQRGDEAVREYTKRFDNVDLPDYRIKQAQIEDAYTKLSETQLEAIKAASRNIKKFAELQFSMFRDIESTVPGYRYGHKILPLKSVGAYVPGGRYPLPSSALMTVIPAKVVGVSQITVCSPKTAPESIVAADIAGADDIYQIGGAQAIAAMAFGTQSIERVDKIVGPGNQYVTAAKKQVYGSVGIDFLAGPSEVMIIADDSADPEIVAADLLAQAEHDTMARADLLTTSKELATSVKSQVELQLEKLSTKPIAGTAIAQSKIIVADKLNTLVQIANQRAPEHLELQIRDPDLIIDQLRNYGSLFIGPYSAEVFGDYCSGPNHTLPTNRVARYTAGLSVKEYIKIATFQELNQETIEDLINTSSELASMEGLEAHKRAAEVRRKLL